VPTSCKHDKRINYDNPESPLGFQDFFITAILALLARPALLEPLPPIALPTADCFGAARGAGILLRGAESFYAVLNLYPLNRDKKRNPRLELDYQYFFALQFGHFGNSYYLCRVLIFRC